MTKEEFNEKYCTVCGSQKCMGIFDEDWSEGCHTWKEVNDIPDPVWDLTHCIKMTKQEMMERYYPNFDKNNYKTACDMSREAMQDGEKGVYLPGKSSISDFNWVATHDTIERLREDGFNIDVVWNPCEYWSIEWGFCREVS